MAKLSAAFYLTILADIKIAALSGNQDEALALIDEALNAVCDCGTADDGNHRDFCDRPARHGNVLCTGYYCTHCLIGVE